MSPRQRTRCISASIVILSVTVTAAAKDWWRVSPIIPAGKVGRFCSIATLPNRQPAIVCVDRTAMLCRYASCDGSTWQTSAVDEPENGGKCVSMTILPSGQPAIAYVESAGLTSPGDLWYAAFNGLTWQHVFVDADADALSSTSLTVLLSGQPAISYQHHTFQDLMLAWYDGTSWQTVAVDHTGNFGGSSSVAILASGQPAISYYDGTNGDLKYAWFDGLAWHTSTVDSAGDVGWDTSLAILPSGYPAISYLDYTNTQVKYAWFDGNVWQTRVVAPCGACGGWTSLKILPSGQPAFSFERCSVFYQPPHYLMYAWYNGSAWSTTTVISSGMNADCTHLALLPNGQPTISSRSNGGPVYYSWFGGGVWHVETAAQPGSGGLWTNMQWNGLEPLSKPVARASVPACGGQGRPPHSKLC